MLKLNENKLEQCKVSGISTLVAELCIDLEYGMAFPSLYIKVHKQIFPSEESYSYKLSHVFYPPHRNGPYLINTYDFSSKEEAIEEAIRFIHGEIVSAISAGHEPESDWFIVNDSYC